MPAEPARAADRSVQSRTTRLGWAWIALCTALALHVTDEALTGFLNVYNPTVIALRSRLGWWPMPTFRYQDWLAGLIIFVCFIFLLSPLFFRRGQPIRPLAWIFAAMMLANGIAHTLGTIFGRTVATVHFARPMPGFWSSPFLIAAAAWVIAELRSTKSLNPFEFDNRQ
jgi:hypothetical protein